MRKQTSYRPSERKPFSAFDRLVPDMEALLPLNCRFRFSKYGMAVKSIQ
jgi:hypothetical protein